MCSKLLKILFLLLSAIFIGSGISVILQRDKVLDPKTYTKPFEEEEVYTTLVQRVYEDSQVNEEFDPLAQGLVEVILEEEELMDIFKKTSENNIKYSLDYFKGSQEEFFVYFPRKDLNDYLKKDKIIELSLRVFDKTYKNYDSLPDCPSNGVGNRPFEEEQLPSFNCKIDGYETKEELRTAFRNELEKNFTDYSIDELLKQADLSLANEKTPLKVMLEATDANTDEVIDSTKSVKNFFLWVLVASIIAMVIGGVFALFALLFSGLRLKNILMTTSALTLFTGLFVTILNGLLLLISLVVFVPERLFEESRLEFEDIELLSDLMAKISFNIFIVPAAIGAGILVVGILMVVLSSLIPSAKKKDEGIKEG